MNRRRFIGCAAAVATPLVACGGSEDMGQEFTLQQSPIRKQSGINTPVRTYGEGSWTPNTGGTATYNIQWGRWTRIGERVFIDCYLSVNVRGTGAAATILGLPFPATNTPNSIERFTLSVQANNIPTAIVSIIGIITQGSSQIELLSRTGANIDDAANTILGDSSVVNVSGSYITASE